MLFYCYVEIKHLRIKSYMTLNLEMVNEEGSDWNGVVFHFGKVQFDF